MTEVSVSGENVIAAEIGKMIVRGRFCVYIHIYTHIYTYTHICIYKYITAFMRVRATLREWSAAIVSKIETYMARDDVQMVIYMHTHIHTHI